MCCSANTNTTNYSAYGNVAQVEIADIDNPLRFQGQYFDAETGLHYNRHPPGGALAAIQLNGQPLTHPTPWNHFQP